MDLWYALAAAAPDLATPLVACLSIAAALTAIFWVVCAPRLAHTGVAGLRGALVALVATGLVAISLPVALIFTQDKATNLAGQAIEAYLLDTYDINTLDPIAVNYTERTAIAEGVNADGQRVTVDIAWLSFDSLDELNALDVADTFKPVTITRTIH